MTLDSKESTLSRWSRRKLEAQQTTESETPEVFEAATPETTPNDDPAAEPPVLTDADMPDIESLTEDSDFSGFMSPGVSDELRNLALRKLFRAPVFNIRDGLDEYDDDFTTFEKLGDIVTSDMKHRMEMEQEKLREALAAENEAVEAGSEQEKLEAEFDEDDMEAIEDDIEDESTNEMLAATDTDQPADPIESETIHERH